MQSVRKTIEVGVTVATAYNQWTQFEEFPLFMEGVKLVEQLDDKRLRWVAEVAGREKSWESEIYDQVPDTKIAWRSLSGARTQGIVTFDKVSAGACRITLQVDYDPEGVVEAVGDKLGFVSRRVQGDLERFKEFIEGRGRETGAWRGEIHGDTQHP